MGSILGLLFGYRLAGILGAVLGLLIGSHYDQALARALQYFQSQPTQLTLLNQNLFLLLGRVCKLNGYVSPAEIAFAEHLMQELKLSNPQKQMAIAYFQRGKSLEFDLTPALKELQFIFMGQKHLARQFIEILLQSTMIEGAPSNGQQSLLLECAKCFGLPSSFLVEWWRLRTFSGTQDRRHREHSYKKPSQTPSDELAQAYSTLGLSPPVTQSTLKTRYRQLLSKHHPDKASARGASAMEMRLATEKTQKITKAYELIQMMLESHQA